MPVRRVVFDRVWKDFQRGERHDSLRDLVPAAVRRLSRASQPAERRDRFWAVRDVSFSLQPGERFGLVGESGSGKSTTILALMRMLRGGRVASGSMRLNGRDISAVSEKDFRAVRSAEMSLVPQGAMSSLNPVLRIGRQFADIYDDHGVRHGRSERRAGANSESATAARTWRSVIAWVFCV